MFSHRHAAPSPFFFREKLAQYGMWGGIGITVYGVSVGVMNMVSGFMGLDFMTVGMMGYAAGVVSGATGGLGIWYANRVLTIRPEPVYKLAVQTLKASEQVYFMMGSDTFTAGKLR